MSWPLGGFAVVIRVSLPEPGLVAPVAARTAASGTMHRTPARSPKGFPRIHQTRMRVAFGRFTFDTETRELLDAGTRVHLSPKAFDLLQAAARSPADGGEQARDPRSGLAGHVRQRGQPERRDRRDPPGARRRLHVRPASSARCTASATRSAARRRHLAATRPTTRTEERPLLAGAQRPRVSARARRERRRPRSAVRRVGGGLGRLEAACTARRGRRGDDDRRSGVEQRHLRRGERLTETAPARRRRRHRARRRVAHLPCVVRRTRGTHRACGAAAAAVAHASIPPSADARQQFAERQRHDAGGADRGARGDHARTIGPDLADDGGVAAERMRPQPARAPRRPPRARRSRRACPRWPRATGRGRAGRTRPAPAASPARAAPRR